MKAQDNLFLGIKGHVVCLQRNSGQELWRTKLRTTQITTVAVQNDEVYATARGHLYSLEVASGAVKWENELTGLGHGVCVIGLHSDATP